MERELLRKILGYEFAIMQNNFDFISELENKSVRELDAMASLLKALYNTSMANSDFPSELDSLYETKEKDDLYYLRKNYDYKYDSPTEKLLDFVMQLRVQKKDARFKKI